MHARNETPSADRQETGATEISGRLEGYLSAVCDEYGQEVADACRRLMSDPSYSPTRALSEALSSTGSVQAVNEEELRSVYFNSRPTLRYRDGRKRVG